MPDLPPPPPKAVADAEAHVLHRTMMWLACASTDPQPGDYVRAMRQSVIEDILTYGAPAIRAEAIAASAERILSRPAIQHFKLDGAAWRCAGCTAILMNGRIAHDPGCEEIAGILALPAEGGGRDA